MYVLQVVPVIHRLLRQKNELSWSVVLFVDLLASLFMVVVVAVL
jgi:hypothetical protein